MCESSVSALSNPSVFTLQVGFWTVKAQAWPSRRPATCRSALGSGCVWVRLWPKWSCSSSCPGSCSDLLSVSHQTTLFPVWRASLVWSCSLSSTRWKPHPDQAGIDPRTRRVERGSSPVHTAALCWEHIVCVGGHHYCQANITSMLDIKYFFDHIYYFFAQLKNMFLKSQPTFRHASIQWIISILFLSWENEGI